MSPPSGKAPGRTPGDRPQVQAWRHVQPSGTNRPSPYPHLPREGARRGAGPRKDAGARCARARCAPASSPDSAVRLPGRRPGRLPGQPPARPAAMEEGTHPDPSRTRKLSPPSPMVLRRKAVGEQDAAGLAGGFSTPREGRCMPAAGRFFHI
jgi:hypothetical protein